MFVRNGRKIWSETAVSGIKDEVKSLNLSRRERKKVQIFFLTFWNILLLIAVGYVEEEEK